MPSFPQVAEHDDHGVQDGEGARLDVEAGVGGGEGVARTAVGAGVGRVVGESEGRTAGSDRTASTAVWRVESSVFAVATLQSV
mmetsp:Transcript_445/g.652  ORF Transcript_445/g.652 Transcript_445/m.652 type:complete len:83 (+) Transcript_445:1606-1854(+)